MRGQGSLAGRLGASQEGSACQGTHRGGAAPTGTMPKAHRGFNLQSCLISTQSLKQEQCNSSDTKHKSSYLKTNPASLPTHCVLAKLSFLPALLSNTTRHRSPGWRISFDLYRPCLPGSNLVSVLPLPPTPRAHPLRVRLLVDLALHHAAAASAQEGEPSSHARRSL